MNKKNRIRDSNKGRLLVGIIRRLLVTMVGLFWWEGWGFGCSALRKNGYERKRKGGQNVLEGRQDTCYFASLLSRFFMGRVALASSSLDILGS